MREVHPEREVTCQAVTAAAAEDEVEDAEFFSDGCGPTEEDVSDDGDVLVVLLLQEVLDELFEGLC